MNDNTSRAPDKPQLRSLRPARALALLLLRTALWTMLVIACALYCLREGVLQAMAFRILSAYDTAQEFISDYERRGDAVPEPVPFPLESAALSQRGDTTILLKSQPRRDRSDTAAGTRPALRQPRQRLESNGGNWFSKVEFTAVRNADKSGPASAVARRHGAPAVDDNGLVLPEYRTGRAVALRGAAPVPPAAARRYSGVDHEAERIRSEAAAEREKELARQKQLRAEQYTAAAIILLAGAAIAVLLSRVPAAVRELHNSKEKHWTLK